jgi:glucosylglycerate hydrolase
VRSLQRLEGAAVHNPGFDVCSIGFNALAAFNARELASLTDSQSLLEKADELADAIDTRWDPARTTWTDACLAGPLDSSAVRTVDSLLPILVSKRDSRVDAAFGEIFSETAFWRPFGPTGTATDEPSYNPNWYWRGPVWPQLSYLIMLAAVRKGRSHDARLVADSLIRGAVTSGFSEYWHPDTGRAKGATPQGWATLALDAVMTSEGR